MTGARRAPRAALLSALVFPGAGQFALRRYKAALAYAGASVAGIGWLLQRVWVETLRRIPADPEALVERLAAQPGWPLQLAAEIRRENEALFRWTTLALVAVWALSIWDAWRAGRAADRAGTPEKKVSVRIP